METLQNSVWGGVVAALGIGSHHAFGGVDQLQDNSANQQPQML